MFSKKEILELAKMQLSLDFGCTISDLNGEKNVISTKGLQKGGRFYEEEATFFRMLCIGNKAVFSVHESMVPWVESHLLKRNPAWLFDFGTLRAIDEALKGYGYAIDETPMFYLPRPQDQRQAPLIDHEIRWHEQNDILKFKGDRRFGEAFIFDENAPDVLGVSAHEGNEIIGMAGASADSNDLYQIGIDVCPEFRGRGISSKLVALLKDELLNRGKVPFYKTAASHIASRNTAINAGFFPAWVELYSIKLQE